MTDPLIEQFTNYVLDVVKLRLGEYTQTGYDKEVREKLVAVLGRLVDSAVRRASSRLIDPDVDLGSINDTELADKLQMHVQSRSGGKKLPSEGVIVDPPEGWRYGFPMRYEPFPSETFEDFLLRHGYPEKLLELASQYSRYWMEYDG